MRRLTVLHVAFAASFLAVTGGVRARAIDAAAAPQALSGGGSSPTEEKLPARDWTLFSVTEGGTVSLLHDLTEHECQFAYHRLLGLPATPEEVAAQDRIWRQAAAQNETLRHKHGCDGEEGILQGVPGPECLFSAGPMSLHVIQPGDIKRAECFK